MAEREARWSLFRHPRKPIYWLVRGSALAFELWIVEGWERIA